MVTPQVVLVPLAVAAVPVLLAVVPVVEDPARDEVASITAQVEGFELSDPAADETPTAERTWTESILGRFW